jgi:hypothetical protein
VAWKRANVPGPRTLRAERWPDGRPATRTVSDPEAAAAAEEPSDSATSATATTPAADSVFCTR